jgi:hypothetical protein
MRHNKAWLSIGLLSFALSMAGCKQTENDKVSPRTAGKGAPSSKVSESGKQEKTATDVDSTSTSTTSDLTATCYQELCKKDESLTLEQVYNSAAKPSASQRAYYKNNFEKLVSTYVSSMLASRETWSSIVKNYESQLPKITLNDTQLSLLKAVYIHSQSEGLPSKLQEKVYEQARDLPFFKANFLTQFGRTEDALKVLYPGIAIKEALKSEAEDILQLRESFKELFGFDFMSFDLETIEKAQRGEELSTLDINYVLNRGFLLRYMNFLAFGAGKEVAQDLILTDDMMMKLYEKSTLKRIAHTPSTVEEQSKYCEGRFYQGLNLYPDDAHVKRFKALEPKIIKAVSELIPNNDKAQQALKKVKISYPTTVDGLVGDWAKGLVAGNTDELEQAASMKKLDPASIKTMILIKAATMKRESSVCDSLISTEIGDMNLRGTSELKISWFSVRIPEYGVSVLAHELAHIVFDSSNTMDSLKSCVKDRQASPFKKSADLSTLNQSEDFADNIAAKVTAKMRDQVDVKLANYGCFFASAENNDTRKLINPKNYDVHSSGLFRAISLAIESGEKIPASCEQLAHSEESKVLNRCE